MKKLLITLAILCTAMTSNAVFANQAKIELLPTMTTECQAQNSVWVGTFQLVWNEVIDNIVKAPVRFIDFNSKMAKNLNKKEFKKSDLDSNAYYTKYGVVSTKLRDTIASDIKSKFNETSDILDKFDWTFNPNKLFVYAMLKKDFQFLQAFDKLSPQAFGDDRDSTVEYFGINSDSNKKLYKNVEVMFYKSNNDFAVKLFTKDNDVVMLYRTDDENKTFKQYYADMNNKARFNFKNRKFTSDDKLKVPNINLDIESSFPELEQHRIKGTNFIITDTIETVKFKMNNEGVKLKSEAALSMKCLALPISRGRNFFFTDDFVLFLAEKGNRTPYYAMKVHDVKAFNNAK